MKKLLQRQGMNVVYCTGNFNALKKEISSGKVPIVFIRTYPGKKWLHYVPVVGYDEENFFWRILWLSWQTAAKRVITER